MITPGLLDRRLTFYERQEAGAYGFARPVYVQTATYWGRIDDLTNRQNVATSPQAHVDQRITARATVADYVAVPTGGYVRIGTDGDVYAIRGVVLLRALRAKRVELERIDPTASATFVGFEGLPVSDGLHMLKTPNGFSTGFSDGYA